MVLGDGRRCGEDEEADGGMEEDGLLDQENIKNLFSPKGNAYYITDSLADLLTAQITRIKTSTMLLLLLIVAVSLLLILATKTNKPRVDHTKTNNNDLVYISNYFKTTFEQSASANDDDVSISTAIRHLNTLIKYHTKSNIDDGMLKLETALYALKSYPRHDKEVKDDSNNKDYHYNNNNLQFIIDTLQSSLSRAKTVDAPFEKDERLSAEIQRRGCLFLGKIIADCSSADYDTARNAVVEKGGLNLVIDAVSWYRFHAGVCKWGLWAAFHICYDKLEYQACFVNHNGIQAVCESIKNNDSVDVTRHGIAILFDILRGNTEVATQAKAIASREGLHDLLVESIREYPDDEEICVMCQQILGSDNTVILTPSEYK
eukprot:scaffold16470_cov61-Cyclotella_meneghiniana.AAC.10